MEQISFDNLYGNADATQKEQGAFQLIQTALEGILREENIAPDSIFFREGNLEKSQYSSVYLLNENNLFCRICFRGKTPYLSLSSTYETLIPNGTDYRILSSDPGYCRINLNSVDDIKQYGSMLCEMLDAQIEALSTEFGCCSRYEACSDAQKCIHPNSDMAIKCIYRRNLRKGRIFYGKNRNVGVHNRESSIDKLTYFDVEFANSKNKSLCQLGLICQNFGSETDIIDSRSIYIDPEDGFDDNCVKVHGIAEKTVMSAPSFPSVWKCVENYFTNAIVVGHNVAAADLDALVKNLNRYNLDLPEIYYICTLDLAKTYIPSFAVENYKLSTLCNFFGIEIKNAHDAFCDVAATKDLFRALISRYNIDLNAHIKKYIPHDCREFTQYVSNPVLRKSICEFYGILCGFSIDNEINKDEIEYVKTWREDYVKYSSQQEIAAIIAAIDDILADGIVTVDEVLSLQCSVKEYLDTVSTSPVTLATQILDGILKGITVDGVVSEAECMNLRRWLYENSYLSDHYPFNKAIELIDKVLEDSVITKEELQLITETISEMLNPVEKLRTKINSIEGKSVCLSGNFAYGSKSDVEKYINCHGGTIDHTVKKTTNILLIGDCECQAYSNGTYGTKVKKALEYNDKGCSIQIIKEADMFYTLDEK